LSERWDILRLQCIMYLKMYLNFRFLGQISKKEMKAFLPKYLFFDSVRVLFYLNVSKLDFNVLVIPTMHVAPLSYVLSAMTTGCFLKYVYIYYWRRGENVVIRWRRLRSTLSKRGYVISSLGYITKYEPSEK
jgi:hypothetical protein